jgi:outer membrane biogenesis lipoprotein LolB
MTRILGVLCIVATIALAGCAFDVGNTRVDVGVKIDERAIDASLDNAVAKLKAELERRGLQVAVNPEADAVRVVSTTKAGDKFTLVLTRLPTASGKEQTKVRVEWQTTPDRELWLALIVAVGETALQAQG